jgi:hypothetical protein
MLGGAESMPRIEIANSNAVQERGRAGRSRAMFICFLLIFLAGCTVSGTKIADKSDEFDEHANEAIVVVGIGSNGNSSLTFRQYDPTTNLLLTGDVFGDMFITNYNAFDRDRLKVHRVKPGRYALFETYVAISCGPISCVTKKVFGERYYLPPGGKLESDAVGFSVAAGEIIHIGSFDLASLALGDLRGSVRDDTQIARDFLMVYPGIKGSLQTRLATPIGLPQDRPAN